MTGAGEGVTHRRALPVALQLPLQSRLLLRPEWHQAWPAPWQWLRFRPTFVQLAVRVWARCTKTVCVFVVLGLSG